MAQGTCCPADGPRRSVCRADGPRRLPSIMAATLCFCLVSVLVCLRVLSDDAGDAEPRPSSTWAELPRVDPIRVWQDEMLLSEPWDLGEDQTQSLAASPISEAIPDSDFQKTAQKVSAGNHADAEALTAAELRVSTQTSDRALRTSDRDFQKTAKTVLGTYRADAKVLAAAESRLKSFKPACSVSGGNAPAGAHCIFPFTYRGFKHEKCTGHLKQWCYIASPQGHQSKRWGFCASGCPRGG